MPFHSSESLLIVLVSYSRDNGFIEAEQLHTRMIFHRAVTLLVSNKRIRIVAKCRVSFSKRKLFGSITYLITNLCY